MTHVLSHSYASLQSQAGGQGQPAGAPIPTASVSDDVVVTLLASARRILRCRFPSVDAHMIEDACEDSILSYIKSPDAFDPARSCLTTYICVRATRRLIDALRAAAVRRSAEHRAALARPTVTTQTHESPSTESRSAWSSLLVNATLTRAERRFALAWLKGATHDELARTLDATGRSDERSRQVKRVTERLRLRWRRLAARHRLERAPQVGSRQSAGL